MNLQPNPSFSPMKPKNHLQQIHTGLARRTVYDSVAFCNRCGCCAQACPTFRLSGQETDSPRGRNQLARLVLEGKLPLSRPAILRSLETCTLCGKCTQLCAGQIPTAQHVLEMHRALPRNRLPRVLHGVLTLRQTYPKLFRRLVRGGLFLHRVYLLPLFAYLPGLGWLNRVCRLLPATGAGVFSAPAETEKTTLIYLPSLEAEFLQPQIAQATLRLAGQKFEPCVWGNTSSGLFEYVYGNLRKSRLLLRRLIRRHAHTQGGRLPLLSDSIDVYHFLKNAPQLFTAQPRLQAQAQKFAQKVCFVTDLFPEKWPAAPALALPVKLDQGALFSRESAPFVQAKKELKTLFKQNFVECDYIEFDTPAFGYAFARGNRQQDILLEAVKNIAHTQVKTVFTLSGLGALELTNALHRYYPAAKARHIVHITEHLWTPLSRKATNARQKKS